MDGERCGLWNAGLVLIGVMIGALAAGVALVAWAWDGGEKW